MTQSYEERRAYQRGYQRATTGRWPDENSIPDERYRRLVKVALALSNAVDHFMAVIDLDDRGTDPMQVAIDLARDAVLGEVLAARDEAAADSAIRIERPNHEAPKASGEGAAT